MTNPFENLPLNTKKSYVMAVTKEGCEVYVPVDSLKYETLVKRRDEIQEYFDEQ